MNKVIFNNKKTDFFSIAQSFKLKKVKNEIPKGIKNLSIIFTINGKIPSRFANK